MTTSGWPLALAGALFFSPPAWAQEEPDWAREEPPWVQEDEQSSDFADKAIGVEKLEGYAEWRRGELLYVDGQRLRLAPGGRFRGTGDARDLASVPLGYEVKAKGVRDAQGVVVASEIEAKPNGDALFEGDLRQAFDQMEAEFKRRGHVYEEGDGGKLADYGRLRTSGRDVDRVRRIASQLVPPYISADDFRVYVVENQEWNAMAAPNRSIYVFSGLLRDMDDDEVAIVLGHELVHSTHEHSRKQFKKDMFIQLAALGVMAAAETIDSQTQKIVLQVAALAGATAWANGYGRGKEDQADRVGLRYAYQGGYDVTKGPKLWTRFAQKYGDPNKVVNFFLGDHTVAKDRARNLERELALNYAGAGAH